MGDISSISMTPYSGMSVRPSQTGVIQNMLGGAPQNHAQGNTLRASTASNSLSAVSISSTSIAASAESCVSIRQQPMLSNNEMIGLALLLLTLEWMQSNNEEEKKGLLGLMSQLGQQLDSGNGKDLSLYNASSLSIESTQITAISMSNISSAYSATASDMFPSPLTGAYGGGLDIFA